MKAVILSAGQGRRLLPLTRNVPKCLLEVGSRTVLEWQLRMLAAAGVDRAVVVVGFGARAVEKRLASIHVPGLRVRTLFNPLHDRADNLVSCAAASREMRDDFLLLNGDTLADPVALTRLLDTPPAPVAVAVARKATYDADDMKVECANGSIRRVGKDLDPARVHGEAIGFSLYRGRGPRLFTDGLDAMLERPDGSRRWYLSVVDALAQAGHVDEAPIGDAAYAEIDYPHDLQRAQAVLPTLGEPDTTRATRVAAARARRPSQPQPVLRVPLPAGGLS